MGFSIGRGGGNRGGYSDDVTIKPSREVPSSYVPSNDQRINKLAEEYLLSKFESQGRESGLVAGFLVSLLTTPFTGGVGLIIGVATGLSSYMQNRNFQDFQRHNPSLASQYQRIAVYLIDEGHQKRSHSTDAELIKYVKNEWNKFHSHTYSTYDPD